HRRRPGRTPSKADRSVESDRLFDQTFRGFLVAADASELAETDQATGFPEPIALGAIERERFFEVDRRTVDVAAAERDVAQAAQGPRGPGRIVRGAGNGQTLAVAGLGAGVVALYPGKVAGGVERLGALRRGGPAIEGERPFQPGSAFGAVPANPPETPGR